MNELKPCPFCGKNGMISIREYKLLGTRFIPHCSNGSCLLFTACKEYKTEKGAMDAWNRRSEVKEDAEIH